MNIDYVYRDRYKQIRKLIILQTKYQLNTIIRKYDRIVFLIYNTQWILVYVYMFIQISRGYM